jgi:ABC-type transport system involved in cytochrome bd biosynthesis fused ATPase/permease subunit
MMVVVTVTSAIGRFWATAVALVVFFVLWATLSARPWVSASKPADPRLTALQAREQKVQTKAIAAQQTLNRRWAAYRVALIRQQGSLTAQQRAQLAVAPAGPSVIVKVSGAQAVTHSTASRPAVLAPAVPGLANPQSTVLTQGGNAAAGGN